MPNFKKIIKNGFSSELTVTIPPITIPSWPSLFSGLTPEQLGYYWFNHPDLSFVIDMDVLSKLLSIMRNNPEIAVISPTHNGGYPNMYKEGSEWHPVATCDYLSLLIRSSVIEKIGFLNPQYFLYWEDIDFCLRAQKAGFKVCFTPEAVIWHKNAASSGGAGKKTSIYYQTRNRLLLTFKYAPFRAKIAVLKEGIKYLFLGTKWQKRAVKDFFLLKFGPLEK